jgi:membrane associated rhomboid family serine protease
MIPLYDHNPTGRPPVITRLLILANLIAGYLEWQYGAESVIRAYGFIPARALESFELELPHVFSSMFLHAGFGHFAWNMLFLHIFGDNVEDLLGRGRYLFFYFATGVAGALAHYYLDPTSTIPMIGASGAIAGVLGGYVVLHPKAPIIHLNPIPLFWLFMGPFLALPAWFAVGYWFFGNLIGAFASLGGQSAGVAFFAHIGGFLAGLVLTRPLLADVPAKPRPERRQPDWRGRNGEDDRRGPHNGRRRAFWKESDGPFWR